MWADVTIHIVFTSFIVYFWCKYIAVPSKMFYTDMGFEVLADSVVIPNVFLVLSIVLLNNLGGSSSCLFWLSKLILDDRNIAFIIKY